jgi:hypothetical protein
MLVVNRAVYRRDQLYLRIGRRGEEGVAGVPSAEIPQL